MTIERFSCTLVLALLLQLVVVAGSAWAQALPDDLAWTLEADDDFGLERTLRFVSVAYAAILLLLFSVSSSRLR